MDTIFQRGGAEVRDVTVLAEGLKETVYERAGVRAAVPSERVLHVAREGAPTADLEHALKRMRRGDYAAGEKILAKLLEGAAPWLEAHAGFLRASARALRAKLEEKGHDEALAALDAWLESGATGGSTAVTIRDHRFAPQALLAAGEAALLAGKTDTAHFEKLAALSEPWASLGRWGLAERLLAAGDARGALAAFEKLEASAARSPWTIESAMLARIGRAAAHARAGEVRRGVELLQEAVDSKTWVGTPLLARALNVLADLYGRLASPSPSSEPPPEARIAGLPFWLRVVRYSTSDPIERARALARAARACALVGQAELGGMMQAELERRFPAVAAATSR